MKTKFKQTEIGMVPEDWEVKILGDTCELVREQFIPDHKDIRDYIGLEHIEQGTLRLSGVGKSNDVESNKLIFKKGYVLFGKLRPYFRKVYRPNFDGVCSTDIFVINGKSGFDNGYLFYFFANPIIVDEATRASEGTRMPRASWDYLSNVKRAFPPLPEQRAIAKTLSDLDSKIELNQQMNKTLEAIGQTIFKHWFIDFEFPNEEDKPYKSSGGEMVFNEEFRKEIPRGWKVETLGEVLSLLKDGSHNPPKRVKSGIRFIAGASDVKHFDINFEDCSYITQKDYENIHKYWRMKPHDILLTIVGTVGNVAIVKEEDLPFSLQRSIAVLRAGKRISSLFLYFLLNTNEFKQFVSARLNPTAQPGIYLGTLSSMDVVVPEKEVLDGFDKLVKSLIIRMQKNNYGTKNLSQIRDSLLPKLMSGKIRVPVEVRKNA